MSRIKKTLLLLLLSLSIEAVYAQSIPNEWTDSVTRHKLVRLSRRNGNNTSFYFHNNPFLKSVDGKDELMVYYGETGLGRQLFVVNLTTIKSAQLTAEKLPVKGEMVARRHREAIYQCGDSVFAIGIDAPYRKRVLYVFPDSIHGTVYSLNADETLLAGTYNTDDAEQQILKQYPQKSQYFKRVYEAHIPHTLFVIDLASAKLRIVHRETEWTNHLQFSPTNPELLMYCHEGPWDKVDRIWVINVRTGENRLMHKRTMEGEIAGHEFWASDGNTIWFDLQMPKATTFYLGGADVATGKKIRYELKRDEWSIHYNVSPDGQFFAGDGADSAHVAKAKDACWIYLFRPNGDYFVSEKLVKMDKHQYHLEPNVHFSPDGKWIIFRSNMFGKTNIFAVQK
jgi:oligogalacturonide lyase